MPIKGKYIGNCKLTCLVIIYCVISIVDIILRTYEKDTHKVYIALQLVLRTVLYLRPFTHLKAYKYCVVKFLVFKKVFLLLSSQRASY